MEIKTFVFNPFEVNTYIIIDDTTKDCAIIDAGCSNNDEASKLASFILRNKLTPKYLLNTHAHLDHILGNKFVNTMYYLTPHFHKLDLFLYESAPAVANYYNVEYYELEPPYNFIDENDIIKFGDIELKCLHVPGHSPGSICFYDAKSKSLFSGDVLFKGSIGRTDLPGGNLEQLLENISKKILILDDDVTVYPGHGEQTTIHDEIKYNPFLQGLAL